MTANQLYATQNVCDRVYGVGLDEIKEKLNFSFSPTVSRALFGHIKEGHFGQALLYDTDKDYTLLNIYSHFPIKKNIMDCDQGGKIRISSLTTAKTMDLSELFLKHPELDSLPKTRLITTQSDDGLQKDRKGYVFLADSYNRHYHINIEDILERFDYWFTTNLSRKIHDNIFPIPIGALNSSNYTEEKINDIRNAGTKDGLCNCRMSITVPYREEVALWANQTDWIDDFIVPRTDLLDLHARKNYPELFSQSVEQDDYISELANYRYSICPQGNGIDTYRLYECILCNTIPIVQRNYANYIFSKIWPMILVDKYEDDLERRIKDFESVNSNVNYDYGLLLRGNVDHLMERIKYECERA